MTRKRKLLLYIGGVLMAACLAGWIVMLYAEKGRLQNAWEKEFLTRYRAVLNDLVNDLGHFEDAGSYEEQFSCLGAVTDDLMQMKAFMEVHANLMTVTMPEIISSGVEPSGWREAEKLAWQMGRGGTEGSYKAESFGADGAVSEEEAAMIRLLREETEALYHDLTEAADGGSPRDPCALSSAEVYKRLTELLQRVRRQKAP